MRCLYCGKELALLKRWTGGGEFCSDGHRQRYQEEYNQLALNRLLQAKPQTQDEPSDAKAAKPVQTSVPVKEEPAYVAPRAQPEPVALKVSEPKPARSTYQYEPPAPPVRDKPFDPAKPEPVPVAKKEVAAPAEMAGFLVEMPIAALSDVAAMAPPQLGFLDAVAAALPDRNSEAQAHTQDAYPDLAGLVPFERAHRATIATATGREKKVEIRDFLRLSPIVEIDLVPAGATGLETPSEPMEILIFPQPPQASPALWQESAVSFAEGSTELGDLSRLAFATTGFSEEQPPRDPEPVSNVAVAELPEIVDPPVEVIPEPLPEPVLEMVPEPEPEALAQPVSEPEPEPIPPPIVEPVPEPIREQAAEPVVSDPRNQPLPLNISGAAPGKGKPLQIFSSAANAVEAEVPRSTSLPLRPVMIFGPAPVIAAPVLNDAKADPKPEPKKPMGAPVRPDPRVAVAPLKPAVKVESKREKKPEVKEPLKLKDEPKPSFPAPLAAPYPGSNDLIPAPSLQSSSGGFLSQIPMLAKIGIAVVLLAGLGGLIAYSSKTGGAATTSNSGAVVAGTALPAGESGWITDWGADPGVRRTRQISILRASQTLTDYRIEMQGQIESKAIGWVFRAADPKNFYVTKLEIVKPGLEPTVALVRFAIVNGEEQVHAQLPLSLKARLDTMYKIRFDAIGNHFTTYVQDEKVDDWTDDRIKTGGVGFYRERGEDATLKGGMSVIPLSIRK